MNTLTAHRARLATVAVLAATLSFAALPAHAAQTADTTTTFEVAAGGLAITAPATANLGSTVVGGTISAALGQVKVDDTRGVLLGAYKASVSSTDFKTGTGTANETIAVANVAYTGGVVTATGTVVCASLMIATPLATTAQAAMDATGATGENSCAWNPTIDVTPPAATLTGTYTGTITHSVA